eukprot:CAMPEP_0184019430 /NCGR_PEP_ID=MMETSP0954-20121128/8747_1 /TAXON_ID=627963 /ORGANISM="Aplanochytrium sp, Strain PBS07" /LENGTH=92 /DNA_ID=CAMNT_0026301095 /DNA_START=416 /DNA_END=695 /DNA_ORIENTATION=+
MGDEMNAENVADGLAGNRFEIKRWNAVALWAWDIVVDIVQSAETISWIYVLNAKRIVPQHYLKNVRSHGAYVIMHFISIAFQDGLKPVKFVR